MNELLKQLEQDIYSSINKTLKAISREEYNELSFFCSEEKKMIEAQRKNAA